jgi:transcriptional regulator with XRE-family HTH domain
MSPLPESVGARIRDARQHLNLTQDALARACGVSRSAVAQWETGRAGQLSAKLPRIADALGLSVDQLLQGQALPADTGASTGDELALLRLYRECAPEDRAFLLRAAHRMARIAARL